MRRFAFPGRSRLRSRVEFDRVFKRCVRSSDNCFTVLARINENKQPRLGLVISAKSTGNAVARQRIKRQVRESFRLAQHDMPDADFVVISRPGVRSANNEQLRTALGRHWKRIAAKCKH